MTSRYDWDVTRTPEWVFARHPRSTPCRAGTQSSREPRGSTVAGTAYGNTTYPGGAPQNTGYSDPSQWGTGTPGVPGTQVDQGRMTIDTVVQKTGITLAVVVLAAAATWFLTGDMDSMTQAQLNGLYGISLIGAHRRLRAGAW